MSTMSKVNKMKLLLLVLRKEADDGRTIGRNQTAFKAVSTKSNNIQRGSILQLMLADYNDAIKAHLMLHNAMAKSFRKASKVLNLSIKFLMASKNTAFKLSYS